MCRFSLQSKQTGLHHPWPKMKIRRFLLGWIETKEYERKTSCSLCHELPTTKPVGVKFRSIAIICSPLIVSMDYFLDIIRDFLLNWWTLSVNCKLQCYWKFAIDGTSMCFKQWTSFEIEAAVHKTTKTLLHNCVKHKLCSRQFEFAGRKHTVHVVNMFLHIRKVVENSDFCEILKKLLFRQLIELKSFDQKLMEQR